MADRTFPKHIENRDEAWRSCCLCGHTSSHPEPGDGEATPDDIIGGCLYPESQLMKRDGKYYCAEHYAFRFHKKDIDDQKVMAKELMADK